jgi:hypothetical protein
MIRLTTACLSLCILGAVSVKTVDAGTSVDVHLVVRQTATPEGQAVTNALPNSITTAVVGTSYVVEIWMQDTWDASAGLTGGEFDLHYDTSLSDATALRYEGPFDYDWCFRNGSIVEESGLIDDFGNGTILLGVGVAPDYSRLGYVAFDATSPGTQHFALDDKVVARQGMGYVDASQINLGDASVTLVPELGSFTLLCTGAVSLLARPWRRRSRR